MTGLGRALRREVRLAVGALAVVSGAGAVFLLCFLTALCREYPPRQSLEGFMRRRRPPVHAWGTAKRPERPSRGVLFRSLRPRRCGGGLVVIASGCSRESAMQDILFLAATAAFFIVSIAYVRFCDRVK